MLEAREQNTTTNTTVLGLDSVSRTLVVTDKADRDTDWNITAATNPTLRIQSADETSPTEALTLSHDQTDARIDALSGTIKFDIAGSTKFTVANGNVTNAVSFIQAAGNLSIQDEIYIGLGTFSDRIIQGELTVLADDTANEFVAIQSSLGDAGGCVISYTCKLTDSTGVRASRSGTVSVQTLDGAAGVTASIGDVGQTAEESGTTTWAFTVDTTDDGDIEIKCQTTTTLTPTAIVISWSANASGDVTLNATP